MVLLLAAIAYFILQRLIVADHGNDSRLVRAIGRDHKGLASLILYAVGIALTFWRPWAGSAIYSWVALMWLIPDQRLETVLAEGHGSVRDLAGC